MALPEDGPHTYAEYLELRRGLVSLIRDELDEHTILMEERAKQAVTHAAAVIQSSRHQERECLDKVERLQERVQTLQQARRTAAAELRAFQQSAAATRQQLEDELQLLVRKVEAAREDFLMVQRQRTEICDEARRSHEVAEQQLQAMTAAVEARFQHTVLTLQAQVRERKAWADGQCALHERRVREAEARADAAESGLTLHPALEAAEAAAAARASLLHETGTAFCVEGHMQDLEREMEGLVSAAGARMEAILAEQHTAEVTLRVLKDCVEQKKKELRELSRAALEMAARVEADAAASQPQPQPPSAQARKQRGGSTCGSVMTGADPAAGELDALFAAGTRVLPLSKTKEAQKDAAAPPNGPHHAASKLSPAPPPTEQYPGTSTPTKEEESSQRSCTASPDAQPPVDEAVTRISPPRDLSMTASTPSPSRRGALQRTAFSEQTIVRDMSCSFDAFVSVSPVRMRMA